MFIPTAKTIDKLKIMLQAVTYFRETEKLKPDNDVIRLHFVFNYLCISFTYLQQRLTSVSLARVRITEFVKISWLTTLASVPLGTRERAVK